MIHVGPEPPWDKPAYYKDGGFKSSYGEWVEIEPLWTGHRVWKYVDAKPLLTFLDLMQRITPRITEKVSWLEDEYMPKLKEILG